MIRFVAIVLSIAAFVAASKIQTLQFHNNCAFKLYVKTRCLDSSCPKDFKLDSLELESGASLPSINDLGFQTYAIWGSPNSEDSCTDSMTPSTCVDQLSTTITFSVFQNEEVYAIVATNSITVGVGIDGFHQDDQNTKVDCGKVYFCTTGCSDISCTGAQIFNYYAQDGILVSGGNNGAKSCVAPALGNNWISQYTVTFCPDITSENCNPGQTGSGGGNQDNDDNDDNEGDGGDSGEGGDSGAGGGNGDGGDGGIQLTCITDPDQNS